MDYKTNRLDGVADVEAEMQARHGVQLGQYRFAWERVTEKQLASARIVALRGIGVEAGHPSAVILR